SRTVSSLFFSSLLPLPPLPSLFSYTTLFRSHHGHPLLSFCRSCRCIHSEERVFHRSVLPAGIGGADVGSVHVSDPKGRTCFHLRSEEHTSELQSRFDLVCRLLLEKKKLRYA